MKNRKKNFFNIKLSKENNILAKLFPQVKARKKKKKPKPLKAIWKDLRTKKKRWVQKNLGPTKLKKKKKKMIKMMTKKKKI